MGVVVQAPKAVDASHASRPAGRRKHRDQLWGIASNDRINSSAPGEGLLGTKLRHDPGLGRDGKFVPVTVVPRRLIQRCYPDA